MRGRTRDCLKKGDASMMCLTVLLCRIFETACARLAVRPDECVFLDDLGQNLKGVP